MKVKQWHCEIEDREDFSLILRALNFLERSYHHRQLNVKLCCNTDCGVDCLFGSYDSYFGTLDEDDNLMCDIDEDGILLILQAVNYQIKYDGRLDYYELPDLERIKNEILRVVELNGEEEKAVFA